MKFFVDSANVADIKRCVDMGLVDGVTTNPSLVAKQDLKFEDALKQICEMVNGPVSAEVTALEAGEMLEQAKKLGKIHKNIIIKLPCTEEGLKATRKCSEFGLKVNMTLVFSANQALLAAKAGAAFVSPFVGRLDDEGHDGMQVIEEIKQIFDNYDFKTKILVASVRSPWHVKTAALIGAHVCTCPPGVILQLVKHAKTDEGIKKFLSDWKKTGEKI